MSRKTDSRPKIYLAGKITGDNWRHFISDLESKHYFRALGETIPNGSNCEEYKDIEFFADDYIITGPHSIGCDHSCFHRMKSKHASTGECVAGVGYRIEEEYVYESCIHQIEKSDIVFSYINSLDAFGTFAEIGYAAACKKFIFILFKNEKIADDLWFISNMASVKMIATKYNVNANEDSTIDFEKRLRDELNSALSICLNEYNNLSK